MNPGDVVADRFVVEVAAARGGMGVVWRAHDRHTKAAAAIKIVHDSHRSSVERFTREARILAELDHPTIVRYLGHGRTGGGELYLAMEWLDGEDLGARLARSSVGLADSLTLTTQVAAALAMTHARQVVHRDIKPSNIFLVGGELEQVKLLDFGVARLASGDNLTGSGALLGTPLFMAPEQISDAHAVDARADVFSLGGVLFRLLTGRHPFTGDSVAQVLARIANGVAPAVRTLRPDVSADVDELVAAMLAREPADRPRDGAALLERLLALDLARAPTLAPAALTASERRTTSFIALAGPLGEATVAVVRDHGARIEAGARTSFILPADQPLASDQVRQLARCALALRRVLPNTAISVISGRGAPQAPALEGAGIRVDAATAGLLDASFDVAGGEGGLWLRGEREGDAAARILLGAPTPFVGRDHELTQLLGLYDICAGDGEARAVLVTAPAGMGKSRLRQELAARLRQRGVEVWIARADPMRAGAPFTLAGDILRGAAGIRGDESPEARRERLRQLAPEHAEFINEIAGLHFPEEASPRLRAARLDPVLMGEQLAHAWRVFLAAACAAHPVVLILEDLHWGDRATVKLLDAALRDLAGAPLLVLGFARPEVHDVFPQLWAERGVQEIRLRDLSRKACERLVGAVLGDRLSAEQVAGILERAAGHPFYLEELMRHAAAGGDGLPETILAMLESRLQGLDGETRRVLRAAAIFGEVFWTGGVHALVGEHGGHVFARLAEREIVTPRQGTRFAGEREHAFRHALVREAAYAMLTDEDRELGHRLAGAWLERAGETDAVVLAQHYERGGDRVHAAAWACRAAAQAMAANDLTAAMSWAERGVASGAEGKLLGELYLFEADILRWSGRSPDSGRAARAAMSLLPRDGDEWYRAASLAAIASGNMGDVAGLEEVTRALSGEVADTPARALAIARAAGQGIMAGMVAAVEPLFARLRPAAARFAGDPATLGWIHSALADRAGIADDLEGAVLEGRESARQFALAGDHRAALSQRAMTTAHLPRLGAARQAEAELGEVLGAAQRLAPISIIIAQSMLAHAFAYLGRAEEGVILARELLIKTARFGDVPRGRHFMMRTLGVVLAATGDDEGAIEALRGSLAAVSTHPYSVPSHGLLACALVRRGHAAEALAVAERGWALLDAARGVHNGRPLVARARAEALHALGRIEEARTAIAEARDWLVAAAARIVHPPWREGYLTAVPEHVAILTLARDWGAP